MMIDSERLKERIQKHKEAVKCDNPEANAFYQLAHNHIIELVEIEELATQMEEIKNGMDETSREEDKKDVQSGAQSIQ